jgi:RNA polymerase sigma factor (TIGR02999 family)
MSDVTRLLDAAAAGDARAAADLLPAVYAELRKLAAARLAVEPAGHSLNATALVHEAYVRLVRPDPDREWNGRGHFFGAAAEAMRRILVEIARRKRRVRHGGDHRRVELGPDIAPDHEPNADLLALDAALTRLAGKYPIHARLVELRYFAGLSGDQAAAALAISASTADRNWVFARAWLRRELGSADDLQNS